MPTNLYRLPVLFLALFILSKTVQAQCPITADAGADKFVCSAGETVQLDGSISGAYLGVRWAPVTGLDDPNILTPTATVNSSVTYTLTGAAFDPSAPNLVINPDFESGNTGFTSSLVYTTNPITPGSYFITTSPAVVLSTFPPCDDHTYGNGLGNMMLINGTGTPNSQVWCQTIPVTPNSWYYLSAWVMNSPITPPTMQFAVNNVLVGSPFAAASNGCEWQEFTATWFSGAATSANLCIRDLNTGGNGFFGDDYALDDIFMAQACTATDAVTVAVATVNAVLPLTVILPCSAVQNGIQLDGSASSSGPGYSYSWDGPSILSGQNTPIATVNEPGLYTLTVFFDTGSGICTKSAAITVLPDPTMVVATATGGEDLTCIQTTAMLNGAGSTLGPNVGYNWQPASGLVSGQGTLMPEVNQPGVYTLTVTHNISGCTATATAFVSQNIVVPVAVAGTPGPITCTPGTITMDGTGSSTGSSFIYLWTGPGIVSGANTLNNCVVNAPGLYTLLVTNEENGCTAAASAPVTQTVVLPVAIVNAEAPGALDCITPNLTLNSAGSSTGATFSYLWTTVNGHFSGPVNEQTATVDSLGSYILTVTNTQSGCTKTDTVSVGGNFTPPAILISQPVPALNCNADSVLIDAGQSSSGPAFSYVWTTANGNILSGDSTLMPWVDEPGSYTLLVTDTANGCTSTDTTTVIQHDSVSIDLVSQNNASCFGAADGELAVVGGGGNGLYTYEWNTGPTTPALENLAAETYTVTVTDGENCSATISLTISQPDELLPNATATGVTTPGGSDGTATAAPEGGTAPYDFAWNTGQNEQTIVGLTAGFYTVTVTDTSGCTAAQTVEVLGGNCNLSASINATDPACYGLANGTATATPTGGAIPLAYAWSSGSTSQTAENLAAGDYTVTITDANDCTFIDSVSLNQPMLLTLEPVNIVNTTCPSSAEGSANVMADGGTGMVAIQWNNGQQGPMATGLSAGTYTATATDSNGCVDTLHVLIQADDQEPPTIQASATLLPVGPSGSVSLSPQNLGIIVVDNCTVSGISFQPESFDCSKLGDQEVTVVAVDSSGNSSTLMFNVTVVDQQAPMIVCPADVQHCFGDDLVEYPAPVATDNCLMLGGQFDLIEGLPSGAQFPEGSTTTTYTFTDLSGNVGSCSFQVTILSPLKVALDTIIQDVGGQNTGAVQVSVSGSLPGYSYAWLRDGQTIATTEDLAGVGAGIYTLLVTDANACSLEAGPFQISNLVGTSSIGWSRLITVYPNPSAGKVFVVLPDALAGAHVSFTVFDALGRKVQEQNGKGAKQAVLDWMNLADGLYTIVIRAGQEQAVYRVLLDR